ILQRFQAPPGTQILQYVDDLLVSGSEEETVRKTSVKLLNFLGNQGLRVSKKKLQFVQREAKYLGHLISEGRRKINPDRIAGIVSLPPPKTKREIQKLL
ncbi:POL5 protein, partial [Corythaixoides concolor]|nr:POL5 protein [Corythaixoides concolor]